MPTGEFFLYLLILSGSTYLIRAVPFSLVRKKITNPFIKSFLHYIPYTVLTAMTFPAALYATGNVVSALVGLLVAVVLSFRFENLTVVALSSSLGVLICELILKSL
ncbi:MAG: AzlD domain-containing protein [Clostridia bacterium]|nr:AzlD domain-containing protein [Clostridia bacterium]